MIYRNITPQDLSDFFRNIENIRTYYSTALTFTCEEMTFFVMLQQNHPETPYYVEIHPNTFRSVVDKIASIDCTFAKRCLLEDTSELASFTFKKNLECVSRLDFKAPVRIVDLVHEFEAEKQTLACNFTEEMIRELVKRSNLYTTGSIRQNLLRPLRNHMKLQEEDGFLSTSQNPLLTKSVESFDLTDLIGGHSFRDLEDLEAYLDRVFPDVSENSHLNRIRMAALLVYSGVRTSDLLNLRESDVKDGQLNYQHQTIALPEQCIRIMNLWNEFGGYELRNESELQMFIPGDTLIKTHKPYSVNALSVILLSLIHI